MPRVKIASTSQLADGEMMYVDAEGHDVLLSRFDGHFYAIDAVCNHQNGPLENGELSGRLLTCPIHMAIFDLTTGKVSPETPWAADQTCFPVTVEGDDVFVNLP